MDKFRDAYRDAVEELPKLGMSADMVGDELHHYRMKRQRRNYLIVKGCTAATVFLLCGVGTAAAKSYHDSVIRVNETGVVITAQEPEEKEDFSDIFSFFEQLGGVFSMAGAGPEEIEGESCELEVREYDSLEAFFAEENVKVAFPDAKLFGTEFDMEKVHMVEDGREVSVHLYNEECNFSLNQFDHRDVVSYSTAMSFGGQSGNERSFTNAQGLSYVVFDTLDEEGRVISVSAVISVNGWDLTLTFRGFDTKVIERILNSIDLSIYFE